jgi:hypothetical protein
MDKLPGQQVLHESQERRSGIREEQPKERRKLPGICCLLPKSFIRRFHKAGSDTPELRDGKKLASEGESKSSNKKILASGGLLAAGLGLPHIPCLVLSASSLLGVGAYVYKCSDHNTSDSKAIEVVESDLGLRRLHAVPNHIDEPNDAEYLKSLLAEKPGFQQIIDLKQASEPGSKIEVDFIRGEDGKLYAVVCKDGKLCPCSDPLVYEDPEGNN